MKYKVGDKVKIIKYGHPVWRSEEVDKPSNFPILGKAILSGEEYGSWIDIEPEIVGQTGIISKAESTNKPRYAIDGIVKHAWYNENQLELVNDKEAQLNLEDILLKFNNSDVIYINKRKFGTKGLCEWDIEEDRKVFLGNDDE